MKPCPTCFEMTQGGQITGIICMRKGLPTFKRLVTPETCSICTQIGTPPERPQEAHTQHLEISPLGVLKYIRTGWEMPPCPRGYRRRSSDPTSDDAWVLDPLEPVCRHLELTLAETGACGYHRIARRCTLIDSFVGPKTCEICPKKEERDGTRPTT